jgi:DNA-binding beta-propeller fold protein YncE
VREQEGRFPVASDYGQNTDGSRVTVIDMAAGTVTRVVDLGSHAGAHDVQFVPGSSSRVVVTTQGSGTVVEVDINSGRVLGSIATQGEGSHTLAVTADGRSVFTANQFSGTVSHLDLATRTMVTRFSAPPEPEGLAVTPDGRTVLAGDMRGTGVHLIDVASGRIVATVGGISTAVRIAVTPDGRRAVVPDPRCGTLHVLDLEQRGIAGMAGGMDMPVAAEVSPDGRVAFVSEAGSGSVAVLDLESMQIVARHQVERNAIPVLRRGIDGLGWGPADGR